MYLNMDTQAHTMIICQKKWWNDEVAEPLSVFTMDIPDSPNQNINIQLQKENRPPQNHPKTTQKT